VVFLAKKRFRGGQRQKSIFLRLFVSNNPRAQINLHYFNNMPLGEQLVDDLLDDIKRVLISTPQQLPAIYFRFTSCMPAGMGKLSLLLFSQKNHVLITQAYQLNSPRSLADSTETLYNDVMSVYLYECEFLNCRQDTNEIAGNKTRVNDLTKI
jgi:hypothetical protein